MSARQICEQVLDAADVRVDGDRPWDIRVHDEALDAMTARTLAAGGERVVERSWENMPGGPRHHFPPHSGHVPPVFPRMG